MDRRAFIGTVAGGLLAAPLAAEAQQAGKVYRVGILVTPASDPGGARRWRFADGLRELGYVEGQNIAIEYRSSEGRYERLPALAAELVRLKVDVIVAPATPHSPGRQAGDRDDPDRHGGVGDPVGTGLVASLARPGRNVTGLSHPDPELVGKRLELLKEIIPRRLGGRPLNPAIRPRPRAGGSSGAAHTLGVPLQRSRREDRQTSTRHSRP